MDISRENSNHKASKRRYLLASAMESAVHNNELTLLYQPQIDLNTMKVSGVEALLRWQSQSIGDISPGEFIPIAEDSGMIYNIGDWVLSQATRDYASLLEQLGKDIKISINTSIRQLENPAFCKKVRDLFNQHINPHDFYFEITETALMHNPDEVIEIMQQLNQMGICFALDDFGTGYSSMQYLKHLPISLLKIDRSFVRDVVIDESDLAIVNATIQLANGLGMQTIAEGVETEQQLTLLKQHGCEYAQGFYIAKPMPLADLGQWLASFSASNPAS